MTWTVSMLSTRSSQSPFVHQLFDLPGFEIRMAALETLAFHGFGHLAELEGQAHSLKYLKILALGFHPRILQRDYRISFLLPTRQVRREKLL